MMRSTVLGAVVAVVVLAARAGSAWDPRSPAPVPSDATPLTLATAPPAEPLPPDVGWGCADALLGEVRVLRDGDEVVFEWAFGGAVRLVWPRGFSAWLRDGKAEIIDPDGSVVAREGDVIGERLGGTEAGICRVDGVIYPPAS